MSNQTDVKIDWEQLSEEAKDDRRKGKRVPLEFSLEIMGKDNTDTEFHTRGRTRNVSHHGCCFALDRAVMRGDVLELKVLRRDSKGRVESTFPLPFRAQWVVKEGDLWVVGAEMVGAQGPWGMDFPPKVSPVNRS
jgi:hypothetical protein